jgi:GGDEF domain-containing protein
MLIAEARLRRYLFMAGLASAAVVFALFRVFERPGLGLGHLYYVSIVLVAIAGGATMGAAAGAAATILYAIGVYWTPRVPVSVLPTLSTVIRLASYVLVGTLIGYYASRGRTLLARSDALADELQVLARRDVVTGLPNQRAFEIAINDRIERRQPFALVLCQIPTAPSGTRPVDWLLGIGERLTYALSAEADVSRISDHQVAVLAALSPDTTAASINSTVEQAILSFARPVGGWATYPKDAADALGLLTAASERLYARSIARGEDHWHLAVVG